MGQRRRSGVMLGACAGAVLVFGLLAGCTEREDTTGESPPVLPTAFPVPVPGQGSVALGDALDATQELVIEIRAGQSTADRYDVQTQPTAIRLVADGDPYTFAIEGLAQPQPLTPNDGTTVHLTLPQPGEFTMVLTGASRDTAILNVRAAGSR